MLSALTIRFDVHHAPEAAGIATDVFDGRGQRVWDGITTLKEPTRIAIPRGSYLVRARLPAGNDAVGQVVVEDEATVLLSVEGISPDAVIAPAYYLKRLPQAARGSMSLSSGDLTMWSRTAGVWHADEIAIRRGTYAERCEVRYADPSAARGVFAELRFWEPPGRRTQTWLAARSQLFAIPSGMAADAVLAPQQGGGFSVSVHNVRADADALLGYLTNGDFASARTVGPRLIDVRKGFVDAHGLLHGYVPNPGAGAIGGYYVIQAALDTFAAQERDDLLEWARDLTRSCPALPDAGVVLGWQALRRGDLRTARDAFIEACCRGIPMYTIGVRYLVDGLRIVSGGDDDVGDALGWLTHSIQALDWSAQTTTLATDVLFRSFHARHGLDLQPGRPYRRDGIETSRGEPDDSTFKGRRAVIASLTAAPLIAPGESIASEAVEFTPRATKTISALASATFIQDLFALVEAIRNDPWAFEPHARLGPRWRCAIFHSDAKDWTVQFFVDERAAAIKVLTIEPIGPDSSRSGPHLPVEPYAVVV